MKKSYTRISMAALAVLAASVSVTGCGSSKSSADKDNELYVYNWGEYIDESVISQFEEETGIKVIYDMFETNEEMYPIIEAGAISYDAVCPSDYMIQKMVQNDLLAELNFDNIPNIKEIDPLYLQMASTAFDPENKYSMPYFFGTVGILYNKNKVDANDVKSWDILWNKKYKDQIIMEDSVRDTFVPALKRLGFSSNSTDKKELETALDQLIEQKPLVYSYLVDESADEVVAGNASMALVYSGEAAYAESLSKDLDYSVPTEGSNMWIDSWMIAKTCKNQENAEKFLDFLCREDIAMKNFEYVYYATPNKAVYNKLDKETQENKTIFPDEETLNNCEIFRYLDEDSIALYNKLWKELKSK